MSDKPRRIAFCITDLDPGGAERALVQIVTRLDRSRWSPAVYCLSKPGPLVEDLEKAGIPVTCLNARGARSFGVVLRLAGLIKRDEPQVLQTFLYHANIAGRIAGWLAGVPVIVSGIRVAERRSRFRLWLDRATDWMVRRHVAVSRDVAEFSIDRGGLPREKLAVIPNGVDSQRFTNAAPSDLTTLGIPAGSRVLLAVGRLDPQKAPLALFRATIPILKANTDVHLLFVGEGSERPELETTIAQTGLGAQVHLAGWRAEVPSLMQASTCLVLASLWEGLPNVILEAMAARLPVVATRVEGVSELIEEGKTGLVVPPRDELSLRQAMERLLSDREAANRMAEIAQQAVLSHFTWDTVARAYERLYDELCPPAK